MEVRQRFRTTETSIKEVLVVTRLLSPSQIPRQRLTKIKNIYRNCQSLPLNKINVKELGPFVKEFFITCTY